MDYVKGNKAAWEEAFVRAKTFGDQDVARLEQETDPFLTPAFTAVIHAYDLKGKTIGQFCSNNGRELLSVVKNCQAKAGIGFDIAENMVAQANRHAAESVIPCKFVATDILALNHDYDNRFDAVLVTIGALCWFASLEEYFRVVRRCMKPGAVLLIQEIHPFANMLPEPGDACYDPDHPGLPGWSYFKKEPFVDHDGMTYMVGATYESKPFTSFVHPLSDLFMALIRNRMKIVYFQESDLDVTESLPELTGHGLPLSYILVAAAE